MYPVLFEIPILGGIPIYAYGVLVACAFVFGIAWVNYEARRVGQDAGKATDLVFYLILFGVLGSRVLHVLFSERARFFENPLMFFKIWEGGLVWYGGLLGAVIVTVWYMRKYKLPLRTYCDIFAPAVSFGHAIGRMGCLMAGCCYGKQLLHDTWYSIIFPVHSHTFAPTGVPLYPTQIMESLGEIVIFVSLVILRKYKRFEGQIIATYLVLYGILRFFNEFFRGDVDRGFVIPDILSVAQLMSVGMIGLGVGLYIKYFPRKV